LRAEEGDAAVMAEIVAPELIDAHSRRVEKLDPLLGVDTPMSTYVADDDSAALLRVPGAVGIARRDTVDVQDIASLYGTLTRYLLQPVWDGSPESLDQLIGHWAQWVRTHRPRPLDPETEAAVRVPARDTTAARVLLHHGLVPAATVAIRTAGRVVGGVGPVADGASVPAPEPPGLVIRRAGPDDIDDILDLAAEELEYESGLSQLVARPNLRALMRPEVVESLDVAVPWTWIAIEAGRAVGVLRLSTPDSARWIVPVSARQPAAYLGLLSVTAPARGRGIGAALALRAHAEADAAGMAAILLHYGTFNPLSVPFWSRMGYRPLWSIWQVSPVDYLR
jgi:GNAT superfamily N-acetyltransferase